jgi:hypothetical protein
MDFTPAIGPLVTAFIGSWFGALAALARFRKERAFDRQLDWYERTIRSIYALSEAVSTAMLFEDEQPGTFDWGNVHQAHLGTLRAINEAELYGSELAKRHSYQVLGLIQRASADSNYYEPRSMMDEAARESAYARLRGLPLEIMEIARPLAAEARVHMGISAGERLPNRVVKWFEDIGFLSKKRAQHD